MFFPKTTKLVGTSRSVTEKGNFGPTPGCLTLAPPLRTNWRWAKLEQRLVAEMAAGTWIALHVVFRVSGINLRCKNHV